MDHEELPAMARTTMQVTPPAATTTTRKVAPSATTAASKVAAAVTSTSAGTTNIVSPLPHPAAAATAKSTAIAADSVTDAKVVKKWDNYEGNKWGRGLGRRSLSSPANYVAKWPPSADQIDRSANIMAAMNQNSPPRYLANQNQFVNEFTFNFNVNEYKNALCGKQTVGNMTLGVASKLVKQASQAHVSSWIESSNPNMRLMNPIDAQNPNYDFTVNQQKKRRGRPKRINSITPIDEIDRETIQNFSNKMLLAHIKAYASEFQIQCSTKQLKHQNQQQLIDLVQNIRTTTKM